MGLFKSFFSDTPETKITRQEENKKIVVDSCTNADKIFAEEQIFADYLKQLNCTDVEYTEFLSDEQIENGLTTEDDVLNAQQRIEKYKRQLNEYMWFGGDPQYVKNLDKLDLYISIIKRLKEYGWLNNQKRYIEYAEDTSLLDFDRKKETKDPYEPLPSKSAPSLTESCATTAINKAANHISLADLKAQPSYFDGSMLALLGINLLTKLVTVITLGLAYPAMYCFKKRWIYASTVVNGYRLKFTGKGSQLFGKFVLWTFLSIITLGIYTFWLPIKYQKWEIKHVEIESIVVN